MNAELRDDVTKIINIIRRFEVGITIREKIRFKVYLPLMRCSNILLDKYYGVDTEEVASLHSLGIHEVVGTRYEASNRSEFIRILKNIKISDEDVLLDVGSGKGRILLLAGCYPFKKNHWS